MPSASSDDQSFIVSDHALDAARTCVWEFTPETQSLRIRARGHPVLPQIEGDWKLSDFLPLLDGLSGPSFVAALGDIDGHERLNLPLGLSDGETMRLVGARSEDGQVRGLLFVSQAEHYTASESQLEAVFQPIIRLSDGSIAGFEALARWRSSEGKLQHASDFTGQASPLSNSGLAVEMLTQSANALADWWQDFPELKLFVQVNLTGADLFRADVLTRIDELVAADRFPVNSLRLELTEQMALRDFDAGVAAATALQASGVALVLDDFGSGHSSLAWLSAIPAVGIKFDPHLTRLAGTPRTDAILSTMTQLAHSLDMTVTAEGIEDFEKVQFLRSIECDYVQGFAYAHPMTRDKAKRFLISQNSLSNLGI
ncbi:MAG: hypothetical protein CMK07_13795 [Ponticaulis sp.]|nr:hypothetical protein [Ponticaulis sp.]